MRFPILAIALVAPLVLAAQRSQPSWVFNASVYAYAPPDQSDYLQPTITADHGGLHLEGRYNYEAINTASLWAGVNLGTGHKLRLNVTLMGGAVFGDVNGIAPGTEITLSFGPLSLFSQGEYVIDIQNKSGDFFYNWSQFTWQTTDWLQLGLVAQRTRAYQTARDIQRGFFAGLTVKRFTFDAYVFDPDKASPTWVVSAGVGF
jgi:hypothetical protein